MWNLDDTKRGIGAFKLNPGETLVIEDFGAESFAERLPAVFTHFIMATASADRRYLS
jgi:hypothetical protein